MASITIRVPDAVLIRLKAAAYEDRTTVTDLLLRPWRAELPPAKKSKKTVEGLVAAGEVFAAAELPDVPEAKGEIGAVRRVMGRDPKSNAPMLLKKLKLVGYKDGEPVWEEMKI